MTRPWNGEGSIYKRRDDRNGSGAGNGRIESILRAAAALNGRERDELVIELMRSDPEGCSRPWWRHVWVLIAGWEQTKKLAREEIAAERRGLRVVEGGPLE